MGHTHITIAKCIEMHTILFSDCRHVVLKLYWQTSTRFQSRYHQSTNNFTISNVTTTSGEKHSLKSIKTLVIITSVKFAKKHSWACKRTKSIWIQIVLPNGTLAQSVEKAMLENLIANNTWTNVYQVTKCLFKNYWSNPQHSCSILKLMGLSHKYSRFFNIFDALYVNKKVCLKQPCIKLMYVMQKSSFTTWPDIVDQLQDKYFSENFMI